jgi:hypothetical protein
MHIITTATAVRGAVNAKAPPLASITAAANCVGAWARGSGSPAKRGDNWAAFPVGGSADPPQPEAEATAAHMQSTPAMNLTLRGA